MPLTFSKIQLALCAVVLCCALPPVACSGDDPVTSEITIQQGDGLPKVWADTWISEDYPTTPQYAREIFPLQSTVEDRQLHCIVMSPVPPAMRILSAKLYIYAESVEDGTPTVDAFAMVNGWSEAEATYNMASATVPWWIPGATYYFDCNPTVIGTSDPITAPGWFSIDIDTILIRNWYSDWYQHGAICPGVQLRLATSGRITTCSSKYPTVEKRPKLVVTCEPWPKVADPVFSPPAHPAHYPSVSVTITCATPGAEIRYTTDNSVATETSALYTGPIDVTSTTWIHATAFAPDLNPGYNAALYYIGYEVRLSSGIDGYNGYDDTWLSATFPTTAKYAEKEYPLSSYSEDRHLHRFDLSFIPASMKVTTAIFSFYEDKRYIPMAWPQVSMYRVTKHWVEKQATHNNASTNPWVAWGQPGMQPGVDYDPVPFLTFDTRSYEHTVKQFTITSLVDGWHRGVFPNEGVMLKCVTEGNIQLFSSKSEYKPMVWVLYEPIIAQVATPTFVPLPGVFLGYADVKVKCATPDAEIRYTTDGSDPTQISDLYTEGLVLHLTDATVLKARAFKSGMTASPIASGTYDIVQSIAKPVFSPPPGVYNSDQVVAISCATAGVTIHFTTGGDNPTEASPVYCDAINVTSTTTFEAVATCPTLPNSEIASATYIIDKEGPSVRDLATVPTYVISGVDATLRLVATASDAGSGGMAIGGAEYFEGAAGAPGTGLPMAAQDGSFNSPTETITVAINCITWPPVPKSFSVRAHDSLGNWGSAGSVDVSVFTALPKPVNDLAIVPEAAYDKFPLTVVQASSVAAGSSLSDLTDADLSTSWSSAGSLTRDEEWIIADLAEVVEIAAVALVAPRPSTGFPSDVTIAVSQTLSDDPEDWTVVGRGCGFASGAKRFVWQFDRVDARYVRVSGPGVYDRREAYYLWRIAEIEVPSSLSASRAVLTWTAPAVGAYTADRAAAYDVRCSGYPIHDLNFSSGDAVPVGLPSDPGTTESFPVDLGDIVGRIFVALKSVDAVGSWSPISNAATNRVGGYRVRGTFPPDGMMLWADVRPVFFFGAGLAVKSASLALSSSPGFPLKPVSTPEGLDASVRLGLKTWTSSLKVSPAQWKQMKKIVPSDGIVHWRVEGKTTIDKIPTVLYGPTRSAYFDVGTITGLGVSPSHDADGKDAVWPLVSPPPTFSWTSLSATSSKFFVDVSLLAGVPLADRANTVSIAPKGVSAESYQPTAAEWKKIRTLARGGAALYWRVRGTDRDGLLTCGSAPKPLLIDGGEWTLLGPASLLASPCELSWTTTGSANGLVAYNIQISAQDDFEPKARITVNVPARPIAAFSYSLSDREKTVLQNLAAKNGVTTLYWRVRGIDAEKAFTAFSPSQTIDIQ